MNRGKIALALAFPELTRVQSVLSELVDSIDGLIQVLEEGDTHGIASNCVVRITKLAELLKSPLVESPVEYYLPLPKKLRVNLPTVVQTLPQLRDIGDRCSRSLRNSVGEELTQELKFYRHFADSALIDFRVAVEYIDKTIVPEQQRHMLKHMTPEQVAFARSGVSRPQN